MNNIKIPKPNKSEVTKYLALWDSSENYVLQENSLNQLFSDLMPTNKKINEILIKASTLNDFYSTNIFSVFPVAKHILELNIDERLLNADISLVNDIANVDILGKQKCFYSFATKYCSHHKPNDFPIYDKYIDNVLWYFINTDKFVNIKRKDLKNYEIFKDTIINFKKYYKINNYSLKEIDKYLWLLGKKHFTIKY